MKRIISISLSFLFIFMMFTSCKSDDKSGSENNKNGWRIISLFKLVELQKNGMFVVESSDLLNFLDFSSMEESPICDDPTCKHTNSENCSAYNKNNHPFIYNDKLYYFITTDIYEENSRLIQDVQLWQSDISGNNEKKIYTFKGLTYYNYNSMLLDGNTIYMCMTNTAYDEQFNELEPSVKFISYDLEKGKATDHGELISGYSCGGHIYGMWNNKVIIKASSSKINKPYMDRIADFAKENKISEDEALQKYVDEYNESYMEFDASSQNLTECELGSTIGISENYYYYNKNDSLMYLDANGKDHKIDSVSKIDDVNALNGFVSFNDDSTTYLFNESEQQLLELNGFYDIITMYNKNNVILRIVNDDGSLSYQKKLISELEKKS